MNTDVIVHPKLQHFGLTTANLEAMIDWYHKVLGMTVNHRSAAPAGAQKGPSLSAVWASNTSSIIVSRLSNCPTSSSIPGRG